MRYLFALFFLCCGAAAAADERRLSGEEIAVLLPDITATTETTQQDFASDGGTAFKDAHRTSNGRWRVQGDFYCSTWPPSDAWRCYEVHVAPSKGNVPDIIIWIDAELGDRTVNSILPKAK